jgi:hypothetical protein
MFMDANDLEAYSLLEHFFEEVQDFETTASLLKV